MNISKETVPSKKGEITVYTLTNASGASIKLSTVGAGIVSVVVPDAKGNLDDVVIGYRNAADYFYDGPCAGKCPGRYANRIAEGKFTLDGVQYQLEINNGPNHLHGGPEGFQQQIWNSKQTENGVIFTYSAKDGEANYPGNMEISAEYTWSDDNTITLVLKATTDKKTVVNLTNHTYWNLAGENSGSVLDEKLWLACSKYLPTSDSLIPTGEMAPVAGTPMDFTTAKALGQDIKQDFPALVYGKGYDNCWVVDDWKKGEMKKVAELTDDKTGRVLEVSTTQPAAQVYTGNWLAGSPANKGEGRSYNDYDAVAIECQGMPDAPNHDNFPSQVLDKGEQYEQTIVFHLSTK